MRAEIKVIYSVDIFEPLNKYQPEKVDNFGFNLRMIIGPEGQKGEESFDMFVCTPEWLKENHKDDDIIFGRHYLIVFKYDYQSIYMKLSEYVRNINAKSWDEIGPQIGRIGHWEFEDYKA